MNRDTNKVYHIVAVDDDDVTIKLIRLYCQSKKDIRIRTFTNPKKCLYHIRSRCKRGDSPDAVIIDRKMPELPGDALNVLIKDINPKIYSILYTGDDSTFLDKEKACYNFDAVFQKGKSIEMIIDDIKNNLK